MVKKNVIWQGDCLTLLRDAAMQPAMDLVICDPPYNINYGYHGEYDDNMSPEDYAAFSENWMRGVFNALKPSGSFWLIIGDEWAAELHVMAKRIGFQPISWVIWHYTFGVACQKKFSRSHVHLFYYTKSEAGFTFNAEAVRVPSARQLIYKDTRALKGGKCPDDTWVLLPASESQAFKGNDDVWLQSRVCGTFNEKIEGGANQLPEALVARIIRACSNVNDLVMDPMVGTGTVAAVAKKLGRCYIGCEQSVKFHAMATERVEACSVGDAILGEGHGQPKRKNRQRTSRVPTKAVQP